MGRASCDCVCSRSEINNQIKGKMKYTVRKSFVEIVGRIWMPACVCGQVINASQYDIENMRSESGEITRESVEDWLTTHSGDFQSVTDFHASIEDGKNTIDIPWATEDGELAFMDATCDCAD